MDVIVTLMIDKELREYSWKDVRPGDTLRVPVAEPVLMRDGDKVFTGLILDLEGYHITGGDK